MKTILLTVVGIFMIGTIILPVNAQYMGDKVSNDTVLGECIGGWGMCPEQQLAERLENDQKNALFVIIIGVPLLGAIAGFVAWTRRKNL